MIVIAKILAYMLLFLIGAIGGWIIELFYRRLFSPPKKWVNPGFLNGPCLPLYGFGAVALYVISDLAIDWWYKIILFCVLMTLIEYIAGIIFIKGMGIKLWDYSDRWGNLQGIICPLFSLFWTALGAAFLFLLYPPLAVVFSWTTSHPWFSFIIGLLYGILLVDVGLSFNIAVKIRAAAKKTRATVHYELLKVYLAIESKKVHGKKPFIFPFHIKANLGDSVEQYVENDRKEKADVAK